MPTTAAFACMPPFFTMPNNPFLRRSLSQWFMASSPRHPMIYFCVLHLMDKATLEKDLGNFHIGFTTAPGAVNVGFMSFMRSDSYSYSAPAGRYIGVRNRSVTIVGNRTNQGTHITRAIEPLRNDADKHKLYQETQKDLFTSPRKSINRA